MGNGNNGCDPEEQLVVDQTTTVRLEIRGFFMSVYYDDVLMCEAARTDGRTVHENAQIFLADPWHAVANAEVDDVYILPLPPTEGCTDNGACNFDATASADDGSCEFPAAGQTCSGDPLYVDGVITMFPEATELVSGDPISVINLPLDFSVQFDFNPTAAAGGWANLIHFTTGGNCCGYGQRIPGVWFYAGTTRLHIRDGHAGDGNAGCDPEEQLPLNEWTTVRMDMTAGGMEVFYNGVSKCTQEGRDRSAFNNIQVYAADPWHETAAGSMRQLTVIAMDSNDVLVPGATYLTASPMQLVQGTEFQPIDVPLDYEVAFTITPTAAVGGWGNIIHITADGGNCCNYGQRIPGVWFYPGSTRLHIRDGQGSNGNDGCDPEDLLPIGEPTTVRIDINPENLQVYYNDELKCEGNRGERSEFTNAQVFASDPWHDAANAVVDDLYILPL